MDKTNANIMYILGLFRELTVKFRAAVRGDRLIAIEDGKGCSIKGNFILYQASYDIKSAFYENK
ncbi:hypothetical protein HMPREF3191_00750 [Veillonellaceae bacterium DNF00626]|nr:hypothetical protein HMPREF3191_00750 [Veillonellaceae bacterium DNF00626]